MFQLTTQYKKGIIKLAVLLGLLCFLLLVLKKFPKTEPKFIVNTAVQCALENHSLIFAEKRQHKKFRYKANNLSDFQGYQLGLSVSQIDRLFFYRESGKFIYNKQQFQEITHISNQLLDSISPFLIFANKNTSYTNKPNFKSEVKKRNINKVTPKELMRLGIPYKIAYRIVNYRQSINGYKLMGQLNKVWDIKEEHLKILKKNFFCK